MLVACLLVQNAAAMSAVSGVSGQRAAWDRLKAIRDVERYIVVAAPEYLDRTVKMLKKAGNGPNRFIALPVDRLTAIMARLTEKPLNAIATSGHEYPVDDPLMPDDVVIFDKGLSPFLLSGTLEACLGQEQARMTFPGYREMCALKAQGASQTSQGSLLASVPVLNGSAGVYRPKSATLDATHADCGRIEMLQIDRPEDMTIAQALAVYGTD